MGCQQPGGCHTNFHVLCARNIGLYLSEWRPGLRAPNCGSNCGLQLVAPSCGCSGMQSCRGVPSTALAHNSRRSLPHAAIRPDPSRKSAVQYRIYCALHSAAQQASRAPGQLGRDGALWPRPIGLQGVSAGPACPGAAEADHRSLVLHRSIACLHPPIAVTRREDLAGAA